MSLLIADFSYRNKAELVQSEFLTRCQEIASDLAVPLEQTYISVVYPQAINPELRAGASVNTDAASSSFSSSSILAYPYLQEPQPLTALMAGWAQLPATPLTYSDGPLSNFNRVGEALLELAGLSYDEEKGWRDRGPAVIVPPQDSALATFLGHGISHYLQSGVFSAVFYICTLLPKVNIPTTGLPSSAGTELAGLQSFSMYLPSNYSDVTAAREWQHVGRELLPTKATTAPALRQWQLREWD